MKRILLSCVFVALTLSSCGKSIFSKKDSAPSAQNSGTSTGPNPTLNACDPLITSMDRAGMGRIKFGLDQVVNHISPTEYERLVYGSKIHRRSQGRSRYSSQEVSLAIQDSVTILNRFGDELYRNQIVPRAPSISTEDYYSQGNCYAYSSGSYGHNRGRDHGRNRHQGEGRGNNNGRGRGGREPVSSYDTDYSHLGFGLSAGDDVADAGFALSGGTYVSINGEDYELILSYTAVKSRYVLRAYPMGGMNGNSSGFNFEQCRQDPRVQEWTKMPRAQPDINECECGNCGNMSRD